VPPSPEARSLAVFCDFENVALGVREAKYAQFDMEKVLERLLAKGSIVVKKAYCDWERYKSFKAPMHEASFELIEIPHVRQSGKNSADIRMVVDALDLCYTKAHVETFVIISGDSDFSPLVSKLRENNKVVIGLGVKNSSSDLLIENCDEFIYYDDLVRGRAKHAAKKPKRPRERAEDKRPAAAPTAALKETAAPKEEPPPAAPSNGGDEVDSRRQEALDHLLDVVEALFEDRDTHLWGSMVKQTLKRKRPNFSERFHGYRTFTELLEDAERRGLLELTKDERSGGYIVTSFGPNA
jgi:uncharacterized protein (TIGR00288 family)